MATPAFVANPSSKRQARWVTIPQPARATENIEGDWAVIDGLWAAVRGRALGVNTQLWYARVDIDGHDNIALLNWEGWPEGVPTLPYVMSSWIGDDLAGMRPKVRISLPVGEVEIGPQQVRLVENNPVVKVWRVEGHVDGFHFWCYAKVWSGQDAVDIRGAVLWSDPETPEMVVPGATITLEFGEPWAPYFAKRCGFSQVNDRKWKLYSGKMPHGLPVPFRGVILPEDDTLTPRPPELTDNPPVAWDEFRKDLLDAAAEAPLTASTEWRDYPWLAFGRVVPAQWRSPEDVRAFFDRPGQLYDERPLANGPDTGQTGAQAPFGATKDLVAISGDPWRVYELLYSADDYLLRGIHHYERDGSPISVATRPNFQTWNGQIAPGSPDTLGKAQAPYGWGEMQDPISGRRQRSIGVDDQHCGDAYILATYALTGDELLYDCMMAKLRVDQARAMPARGWRDAPRAGGRLLQSWAKAMTLTDPGVRELYLVQAERELAERRSDQPMGNPVHPMNLVVDNRVLPGQTAFVPWNEALWVMGGLEFGFALRRVGGDGSSFFEFAGAQASVILRFGTLQPSFGLRLPLGGVKFFEGGAEPPAGYYDWPRVVPEPRDILVFDHGWWAWMAGAIMAVLHAENVDAEAKQIAEELHTLWGVEFEAMNLNGREWWAIPQP